MWPFRTKSSPDLTARREIAAVREDLEALKLAHERLRGRFYAIASPRSPDAVPERALSKGEILKAAGFVPGKPMNHT